MPDYQTIVPGALRVALIASLDDPHQKVAMDMILPSSWGTDHQKFGEVDSPVGPDEYLEDAIVGLIGLGLLYESRPYTLVLDEDACRARARAWMSVAVIDELPEDPTRLSGSPT